MSDEQAALIEVPAAVRRLEELVLHHERQIQDLSDMVAAQWKDIDKLKKTVQVLQKKILAMGDDGNASGQQEAMSVTEFALMNKPPHY